MSLSKKDYEEIAKAIGDGIYTYINNKDITNNKVNKIHDIPLLTRTRIFTEDHADLVYHMVACMCRYFVMDNPFFKGETFKNAVVRQVETRLKMEKQQQEQTND